MGERRVESKPYIPTYAEQAVESRQMQFPNARSEKATIGAFDRGLTESLRIVDDSLAGQADNLRGRCDAMACEVEEARTVLRDAEEAFAQGADFDMEAWQRADRVYDQIVGRVEPLSAQIDLVSERMEDVLGYASELQAKYPALHRPVLLATDSD